MFVFSEFYALLKVDLHAGNVELIRLLLSKGALVDSQSDSGTPLIWAAGHGQTDAVEVLLEHHANVSMWQLEFKIFCTYDIDNCLAFFFY